MWLSLVVSCTNIFLLFHGFLSTLLVSAEDGRVICKDELGNPIDWWLAYKLPRDPNASDEGFHEGSAYFQMTPAKPSWQRSSKRIHHPDSILAVTLEPLYDPHIQDVAYVLYNDQPPNKDPMLHNGHTKGIIITSTRYGIFLQHSVPHFPLLKEGEGFSYPIGGLENGQLFLCLSLNASQVDSIGEALLYTKPDVYKFSIRNELVPVLPKLTRVARDNATRKSAPWFTTLRLQAGSLDFTAFVKGPKFRKEIYGDWISGKLSTALDVQSWLNGAHPIHSNCNATFPARNILTKRISNETFSTVNDHSKWAVGTLLGNPWICVGDLNKMKPQKTRGGLALCTSNLNLWKAFKDSVVTLQPCSTVGFHMRVNRKRKQKPLNANAH